MKELQLTSTVISYNRSEELPAHDRALLQLATEAAKKAYAPYSQFNVGAALRLASGQIILGNNQENVAYPSGLCAERVALFYASANFPDDPVESIAITANTQNFKINSAVTPCGSCRQVMAEAEKKQKKNIRVIMLGSDNTILVTETCSQLLPLMFEANGLMKT
jgi:cytidine deaminase